VAASFFLFLCVWRLHPESIGIVLQTAYEIATMKQYLQDQ
jgi:hypothetical protein